MGRINSPNKIDTQIVDLFLTNTELLIKDEVLNVLLSEKIKKSSEIFHKIL